MAHARFYKAMRRSKQGGHKNKKTAPGPCTPCRRKKAGGALQTYWINVSGFTKA